MKDVIVNNEMSLIDVALQNNGTIETLPEIARANALSLDYSFSKKQTVTIPTDTNYYSKKIAERGETFATGIVEAISWILADSFWNDDNNWLDDNNWID